jgi:hypothetical protein
MAPMALLVGGTAVEVEATWTTRTRTIYRRQMCESNNELLGTADDSTSHKWLRSAIV